MSSANASWQWCRKRCGAKRFTYVPPPSASPAAAGISSPPSRPAWQRRGNGPLARPVIRMAITGGGGRAPDDAEAERASGIKRQGRRGVSSAPLGSVVKHSPSVAMGAALTSRALTGVRGGAWVALPAEPQRTGQNGVRGSDSRPMRIQFPLALYYLLTQRQVKKRHATPFNIR